MTGDQRPTPVIVRMPFPVVPDTRRRLETEGGILRRCCERGERATLHLTRLHHPVTLKESCQVAHLVSRAVESVLWIATTRTMITRDSSVPIVGLRYTRMNQTISLVPTKFGPLPIQNLGREIQHRSPHPVRNRAHSKRQKLEAAQGVRHFQPIGSLEG